MTPPSRSTITSGRCCFLRAGALHESNHTRHWLEKAKRRNIVYAKARLSSHVAAECVSDGRSGELTAGYTSHLFACSARWYGSSAPLEIGEQWRLSIVRAVRSACCSPYTCPRGHSAAGELIRGARKTSLGYADQQ